MVLWVDLQFVIVVFLDYTHLLFGRILGETLCCRGGGGIGGGILNALFAAKFLFVFVLMHKYICTFKFFKWTF